MQADRSVPVESNPAVKLLLPDTRYATMVNGLLTRIGEWTGWIWLVLLVVIVLNVIMRYLFSEGRIEFEEVQWHLYSIGFLAGLSYGYVADVHIRVDVFRERFSPVTQAWIELYGTLILLIPFILLVLFAAMPFIAYSFTTGEISEAPGGLPYRWVIKSFLGVGFILLLLAVTARLSRIFCFLFGVPGEKHSDVHG